MDQSMGTTQPAASHNTTYSSRTGKQVFCMTGIFLARSFRDGLVQSHLSGKRNYFWSVFFVCRHTFIHRYWCLTGGRSNCWHHQLQYVLDLWSAYRTCDKLVRAPALRKLTAVCPPWNQLASYILSVLWVCIFVSALCTNAVPAQSQDQPAWKLPFRGFRANAHVNVHGLLAVISLAGHRIEFPAECDFVHPVVTQIILYIAVNC